jgi:hypothetical protein
MNPHDFLSEAAGLIGERGQDYGGIEKNFDRAAEIAGTILGRELSCYDVAIILASVKLARMRSSPYKRDNYLDCANYLAFAAEFATR